MAHHTFSKGYIGVVKVIDDLVSNGFYYAVPGCEQLPVDLIALSEDMRMVRLQIKYRAAKKGSIRVPLRSNAGYTRIYEKMTDLDKIDAFAIYCPDTKGVYYVHTNEIPTGRKKEFVLRIDPPANGYNGCRFVTDYQGPDRLFQKLS